MTTSPPNFFAGAGDTPTAPATPTPDRRVAVLEQALATAQRRFRALFDRFSQDLHVFEVVRDGEGRVLDWVFIEANARARETMGDDYALAVGQCASEFYGDTGPGPDLLAASGRAIDGTADTGLHQVRHGARRLEVSLFALDETTIVAASTDVTERECEAERLAAMNDELVVAQQELRVRAETDRLTQLPNRSAILDAAEGEFMRAGVTMAPLSVALFDVDFFKKVNDTWGHAAGDAVLCHIARVLREQMRAGEYVGRYGGEEFLVVFPDVPLAQAAKACERLRQAVERSVATFESLEIPVTISIGLASMPGESLEALISRADAALYDAKRSGRNLVRLATDAKVTLPTLRPERAAS